jgi:hypothetical protein
MLSWVLRLELAGEQSIGSSMKRFVDLRSFIHSVFAVKVLSTSSKRILHRTSASQRSTTYSKKSSVMLTDEPILSGICSFRLQFPIPRISLALLAASRSEISPISSIHRLTSIRFRSGEKHVQFESLPRCSLVRHAVEWQSRAVLSFSVLNIQQSLVHEASTALYQPLRPSPPHASPH